MKEANIIPVPKVKRPKINADFRPFSIQNSAFKNIRNYYARTNKNTYSNFPAL